MLIAMLISVLFFNTTFLEIARYKSLENLYGEIQENAAFSILANYDRDLFKTFGLLAIEDDINSEKLYEYIQANINQGNSQTDGNKIDNFFVGDRVRADLEKLYFLSQREVFENQINEFCAYRAPISIVNNALDLENTLQSLIENLEDAVGGLNDFTEFMSEAESILETFINAFKFGKEIGENYLPAVNALKNRVTSYNSAIKRRDDLIEQIENQKKLNEEAIENGNYEAVVDTSQMEAELLQIYQVIETEAVSLYSARLIVDEKIISYVELNEKAIESVEKIRDKKINLSQAKNDEDIKEMAENIEKTNEESTEIVVTIVDQTKDHKDKLQESGKDMAEQIQAATEGKSGATMTEIATSEENPFNLTLDGEVETVETKIKEEKEKAENELNDVENKEDSGESGGLSISDILKITKLLVELSATGGTFNLDCTETIQNVEWAQLGSVENLFSQQDETYVNGLMNQVESSLDMDIYTNTDGLGSQIISELEACFINLSEKTTALQNTFKSFEISGKDLQSILEELVNTLKYVVEFFTAAIAAINALITYAVEGLLKMIYEKTYAATYATEMFTNRSSSFDDSRLNGSEYTDYGVRTNHEVFRKANAEFIYAGQNSEILNQVATFVSIMGLRIFANIPAVLTDGTLRNLATEVAAIPYLGPVLAVVIYVLIIISEAYLDMIFMIYGGDGVSIVKMEGYLNFEGKGIDELINQIEGISDKLGVEIGEDGDESNLKDTLKETLSNAKEGLTKWDYKQHLFIVLCLFKTSDKMYENIARLIQLQLDKEKDEVFRLSNMATYVRTDTTVYYDPLLPVPYEGEGIPIQKLYYTGY